MLGIILWTFVKVFVTLGRWLATLFTCGCFRPCPSSCCSSGEPRKVVIVGSGFCGAFVAKELAKSRDFEVTIVSLTPHFQYTPSIFTLPMFPEYIKYLLAPLEDFIPNVKVIVGTAKEVTSSSVEVQPQSGEKIVVPYEILVCATGCSYKQTALQSDVVVDDVSAHGMAAAAPKLKAASTVLIIGGGLVGIELAAEIKRVYGDDKDVKVINSERAILHRLDSNVGQYVEAHLNQTYKNISFMYSRRVVSVNSSNEFTTDQGDVIKADIAFFCAGGRPNTSYFSPHYASRLTDRKLVRVNRFFQMEGETNIFVAGDIAAIQEEKMAAHARAHAVVIAENIRRIAQARTDLVPYQPTEKPAQMILGVGSVAVFVENGIGRMFGRLPMTIKNVYERAVLIYQCNLPW